VFTLVAGARDVIAAVAAAARRVERSPAAKEPGHTVCRGATLSRGDVDVQRRTLQRVSLAVVNAALMAQRRIEQCRVVTRVIIG